MAKERTAKELAQRIDPTYFRRAHGLRRARFWLSVGFAAVGAAWLGLAALAAFDGVYAPGPVARAHALIEHSCTECHVERFRAVRDESCLPCHVVGLHARRDPACAHCHVEHRGRDGLRTVGDAFCTGCHDDHKGIDSFENHPGFRVEPREQNIRFSHAAHLKADLKNGPVACKDCHWRGGRPGGGAGFMPPYFVLHCERCHAERLEPGGDDIVPHGLELDELREWIALAYVREMGVVEKETALPGRGREPPSWREALIEKTDAALEGLLRPGGGCLMCHVRDNDGLAPVAIPWDWMEKAWFNHAKHRSVACESCHDVRLSKDANTLSLPTVNSCQQCHKEQGARTSCATCHVYHRGR